MLWANTWKDSTQILREAGGLASNACSVDGQKSWPDAIGRMMMIDGRATGMPTGMGLIDGHAACMGYLRITN